MVIYITASILGKMFVSTTNNKRRILPKKQRDWHIFFVKYKTLESVKVNEWWNFVLKK